MKKIVVFNWKMNPASLKEAEELFSFVKRNVKLPVIIAPPFVFLENLAAKPHPKIKIFAQNISYTSKGAYTGEISPLMLKKMRVWGSIIGHSERRILFNESDALIHKKIEATIEENLVPILCVGERKRITFKKSWEHVKKQLQKDLSGIPIPKLSTLIVAYEPVWSIGGDKPTDADHSANMIGKIKDFLRERYKIRATVLYGGSVDCENLGAFLKFKEIDGFLVGSASLKKGEVSCIIKKVERN